MISSFCNTASISGGYSGCSSANHNVFPSFAAPAGLRRASGRTCQLQGIAEENFQSPAALPPFFLFDLREQLLRGRSLK